MSELLGVELSETNPLLVGGAVAVVVLLLVARRWIVRSRRARRRGPRAGEVWFAEVPFEDGTGSKDRPVLVLDTYGTLCHVARFTSQDRSNRRDHLRVPHRVRGLDRASWADLRPLPLPSAALRRRVSGADRSLLRWYRRAAQQPTG
ncbi:hypothetical protein [Cellulomonas soli]|uniref:PemK-like, MazF-like toxin of type II toxin-antitoxin system n=1 Tax=Cellulomonas soli TaxID=931535 RepID=A0A512PGN4_9CELL|nr:hypothetical protein [Cellulomonas soli]NYI58189.1 hypothetical protein [Cellulomonas soli]GEP70322.1 hypothetical protein CSO01_30370 [Cellulomonas soli]